MPTLREIAQAAGCSVATVCRVLKGGQGVRTETKLKVLRAEMQLKQAASGGPLGTIAVVVPDLLNPYFPQIASGIEEEAHNHGFALVLGNLNRTTGKAERFVQFLRDRQIGQVIIVGGGVINPAFHEIWSDLAQHATLVGVGRHNLSCATVAVDDVAGGVQAIEHLVGLGHVDIATVCGPSNSVPALDRLEGYMTVLFNHHIPYSSDRIIEGDYSARSGYLAGKQLLQKTPLPTAVFCINDLMALGLMRALREAGLRIPEDISVVGYDHLATLEFSMLRLTSVAVPMEDLGREAVRLLLAGGQKENQTELVTLPTTLWLGESTSRINS